MCSRWTYVNISCQTVEDSICYFNKPFNFVWSLLLLSLHISIEERQMKPNQVNIVAVLTTLTLISLLFPIDWHHRRPVQWTEWWWLFSSAIQIWSHDFSHLVGRDLRSTRQLLFRRSQLEESFLLLNKSILTLSSKGNRLFFFWCRAKRSHRQLRKLFYFRCKSSGLTFHQL